MTIYQYPNNENPRNDAIFGDFIYLFFNPLLKIFNYNLYKNAVLIIFYKECVY